MLVSLREVEHDLGGAVLVGVGVLEREVLGSHHDDSVVTVTPTQNVETVLDDGQIAFMSQRGKACQVRLQCLGVLRIHRSKYATHVVGF